MVVWSWIAVLGLVAGLVAVLLAVRVWSVRPQRPINRALALILVVEGFTRITVTGFSQMAESHDVAYFWQGSINIPALLGSLVYLWFLSHFDSPLVGWIRSRTGKVVIAAYAVTVVILLLVRVEWFLQDVGPQGPVRWAGQYGPGAAAIGLVEGASHVFAIAVLWSATRRGIAMQRSTAERWTLAAFVVRDVFFVASLVVLYPVMGGTGAAIVVLAPLVVLLFVTVLTYGILRHQVFDLDLRFRRGLSRGTMLVLVIAAVIGARELARAYTSGPTAEVVAVAALAMLLLSLDHVRRLTDRAVAATLPAPADLDQRKIEVYRAALLESRRQRDPSAAEPLLTSLRGQLGLSERDHALLAHALEAPSAPQHLVPGQTFLGRYRILRSVGIGGQGETFAVHDDELDRPVAIKVLHRRHADRGEAQALARLHDPHVVQIYDVLDVGAQQFLVMQWMAGGDLGGRLADGALPQAAWKDVAWRLLAGLAVMHRAALVHGDIKPGNVLFDVDGHAYLADFGTAQATDGTAPLDETTPASVATLSPERVRGGAPGVADDLWAAAATLWHAATGRPLVEIRPGESAAEVRIRIASWQGPNVAHAPVGLRNWFAVALAADPSRRPTTARRLAAILPGDEDEPRAADADDVAAVEFPGAAGG